jgi:hypothetical protein
MRTLIRKTFRYIKEKGLVFTLAHIKNYYLMRRIYAPFGRRPPMKTLSFETHMADHCNIACWGCSHFSPLSDEWFADTETFAKDLNRLSELLDGKIGMIRLMGGEPLLHPELEKFFPIARNAFPSGDIRVVTNGILLNKKEVRFWRECSAHKIKIAVTVYPHMEKQFEAARSRGRTFGVDVFPHGGSVGADKTSLHYPFDLSGEQSPASSFTQCPIFGCTTLREGRLYPCSPRAYLYIFNKYFPEHALPESEKDSIDIHAAKSAAEIFDFLSRPIPFCRFCHVDKISDTGSWRQSKKEIGEWSL